MDWHKCRLTPAFKAVFGDKQISRVLDNATYPNDLTPILRYLKATARGTTQSLCARWWLRRSRSGVKKAAARTERVTLSFASSCLAKGSFLRRDRAMYGISREQVAQITREYLESENLEKLVERVETFFQAKEWWLIRNPPYMPRFQPLEHFWQYSKHYVRFNSDARRIMKRVHQ